MLMVHFLFYYSVIAAFHPCLRRCVRPIAFEVRGEVRRLKPGIKHQTLAIGLDLSVF
jgi:hypothetical protein